jgi:DNA-binding MarR family transcriptional regulator
MVESTSDGLTLAAIAFAANEQWLRVLSSHDVLSVAELQQRLELKRTQTLEQLDRAESLGLIRRIGVGGKGKRSYWDVGPEGKRLLAGLLALLEADESAPRSQESADDAYGVLALIREEADAQGAADDLCRCLTAVIPRKTRHDLFNVHISRETSAS